jgi:hypothetical protein
MRKIPASEYMGYDKYIKDEQMSVLDKIKAEANAECISDGIGRYIRFDVLEKIIDKYKDNAESEEV